MVLLSLVATGMGQSPKAEPTNQEESSKRQLAAVYDNMHGHWNAKRTKNTVGRRDTANSDIFDPITQVRHHSAAVMK